jgi:hypothetical protein
MSLTADSPLIGMPPLSAPKGSAPAQKRFQRCASGFGTGPAKGALSAGHHNAGTRRQRQFHRAAAMKPRSSMRSSAPGTPKRTDDVPPKPDILKSYRHTRTVMGPNPAITGAQHAWKGLSPSFKRSSERHTAHDVEAACERRIPECPAGLVGPVGGSWGSMRSRRYRRPSSTRTSSRACSSGEGGAGGTLGAFAKKLRWIAPTGQCARCPRWQCRAGWARHCPTPYSLFTLVGIAGEDDLDAPDLAGQPA